MRKKKPHLPNLTPIPSTMAPATKEKTKPMMKDVPVATERDTVEGEDTVLAITTGVSTALLHLVHLDSKVTPSGQLAVVVALTPVEVAVDEAREPIADPLDLIQIPRFQDLTSSVDLLSNLASR